MTRPGPLFEERQRPPLLVPLVAVLPLVGGVAWTWAKSPEVGQEFLFRMLVPLGLLAAVVAFMQLRVTVTASDLRIVMIPFPRKTVPIGYIDRCEVVTYRPFLHYGGWGWRWSPSRGWCYTMSGKGGVRIHPAVGSSFLVGSQRPEQLAAAIEAALGTTRALRSEA